MIESKDIVQLFSYPIFVTKYPHNFDQELKYILDLDYHTSGERWDSTYASQSKDSFVLDRIALVKIRTFIALTLDEFMNDVYGSSDRLTITQSWVNRSGKNCHHPMHQHPNSILSGVWYPSIHEDSPHIQFNKKTPSISFKKHTNNAYNSDNCLIPMKAGDLIIFPSNLSHCVPPNKIDQERVSLSFNTWTKGSIGDEKLLTYLPLDRCV